MSEYIVVSEIPCRDRVGIMLLDRLKSVDRKDQMKRHAEGSTLEENLPNNNHPPPLPCVLESISCMCRLHKSSCWHAFRQSFDDITVAKTRMSQTAPPLTLGPGGLHKAHSDALTLSADMLAER